MYVMLKGILLKKKELNSNSPTRDPVSVKAVLLKKICETQMVGEFAAGNIW